eukprot:2590728-Prymnesium_polylepis.1
MTVGRLEVAAACTHGRRHIPRTAPEVGKDRRRSECAVHCDHETSVEVNGPQVGDAIGPELLLELSCRRKHAALASSDGQVLQDDFHKALRVSGPQGSGHVPTR